MKMSHVKLMVLVFIVQVIFVHNAIAGLIGPKDWNGDDINGFLASGTFPGIESSVSTLDFNGEWMYTAIARESANTNDVEQAATTGERSLDTSLAFSTADASNWGEWDFIDFDTQNLFFEDSNGPWNIGLDSAGIINSDGFKLFQLTEDTVLTYLASNSSLPLFSGDIIVGFNDNHINNSDGDYDDIIIVMRATEVPAPSSFALLGFGLLGIRFFRRKAA